MLPGLAFDAENTLRICCSLPRLYDFICSGRNRKVSKIARDCYSDYLVDSKAATSLRGRCERKAKAVNRPIRLQRLLQQAAL